MNCGLTDREREEGKRCRSFTCTGCRDYSDSHSSQPTYGFAMVLGMFMNSPTVKMARNGWNGKGLYIQLQKPDVNSKMTQPYIYITTADGRVPWAPSQTDVLAMDWIVVD